MTPVEIEVLLHYYVFPTDHPRLNTPAVKEAIRKWVREGIFEPDTKKVTHRGSVLVKMLTDTPMPVRSWKDPR